MTQRLYLTGQTFGRLTVGEDLPSRTYPNGRREGQARCVCICERRVVVSNAKLLNGHTQSCGCLQREKSSLSHGQAAENRALYKIKQGAYKRGLEWALSDEYVRGQLALPCFWCGDIRANRDTHARGYLNGTPGWNGLDRLDNAKGYVYGNVVPSCGTCNRMRNQLTTDAFLERCRKIVNHFSDRELKISTQDSPCKPPKKLGV